MKFTINATRHEVEIQQDDMAHYVSNVQSTINNLSQKIEVFSKAVSVFSASSIKFQNQCVNRSVMAHFDVDRKQFNNLCALMKKFNIRYTKEDNLSHSTHLMFKILEQIVWEVADAFADFPRTPTKKIEIDFNDAIFFYTSQQSSGKELEDKFSAFLNDMRKAADELKYDISQCQKMLKALESIGDVIELANFEDYDINNTSESNCKVNVHIIKSEYEKLRNNNSAICDITSIISNPRIAMYSREYWGDDLLDLLETGKMILRQYTENNAQDR